GAPCPGGRNAESIQFEPLSRNLQAVDVAEDRGGERPVLEQIAGDALHVGGGDALDALKRFVEPELPVEIDLLPRNVGHAAGRVLEAEHQTALEVIFGALQLGRGHRRILYATQLLHDEIDHFADRL